MDAIILEIGYGIGYLGRCLPRAPSALGAVAAPAGRCPWSRLWSPGGGGAGVAHRKHRHADGRVAMSCLAVARVVQERGAAGKGRGPCLGWGPGNPGPARRVAHGGQQAQGAVDRAVDRERPGPARPVRGVTRSRSTVVLCPKTLIVSASREALGSHLARPSRSVMPSCSVFPIEAASSRAGTFRLGRRFILSASDSARGGCSGMQPHR